MKRLSCLLVFMCGAAALATGSQNVHDVQKLFTDLIQPKTTDTAAQRILELASKDRHAREYVVRRLPAIIRDRPSDEVWLNAVRLAGPLRASEAVPALTQALSRGMTGGTLTLAEYMRLDTDVVGKALAEIGDPSVPAVADVLRKGDRNMRQRAALILLNIKTPMSQKALSDHLPNEKDQDIRKLIEASYN